MAKRKKKVEEEVSSTAEAAILTADGIFKWEKPKIGVFSLPKERKATKGEKIGCAMNLIARLRRQTAEALTASFH